MGIAHRDVNILAARALPDGSYELRDSGGSIHDVVVALRAYDGSLSLVHNTVDHTWEIWRVCEDGVQRRVGRCGSDTTVPHPVTTVAKLAQFDTWKGYDPVADVDAHNAKADADRAQVLDEKIEDHADKLHYAMTKDLGMPAARLIPLSGR